MVVFQRHKVQSSFSKSARTEIGNGRYIKSDYEAAFHSLALGGIFRGGREGNSDRVPLDNT